MAGESEDSAVLGAMMALARKDGRIEEARDYEQRLRVVRIIRVIHRELKDAPPLTDEQTGRIIAAINNAGER